MKTTLPRLTTIMITGTLAFLSLQAKGDELQDLKKIVAIQQAQIASQSKSLQDVTKKLTDLESKQTSDIQGLQTTFQGALQTAQATMQGKMDSLGGSVNSLDSRISATSNDLIARISSTYELHSRSGEPFRFYMHAAGGGPGGFMWVFEQSGAFIRYRCGNLGNFATCSEAVTISH